MSLLPFLHRIVAREDLSERDARDAMNVILTGEATTPLIAAFATALRMKGETAAELLGLANAMREHAQFIDTAGLEGVLDTCGTGGDGGRTFNISTIAAFVVAGAGVPVAKHGNRSLSSQCGSADLLEELGVSLQLTPAAAAAALRTVGICFAFAPNLHPAMRHAQPARAELKMRTVFNLLGPLTNPAGACFQLVGAPSVEAAKLMAEAMSGMPHIVRAWVVHGKDGLDEITTTSSTTVFEVTPSSVSKQTIIPEEFGLRRAHPADIGGGDRTANATIARSILAGEGGPRREIVLLNAAAALWITGRFGDFQQALTAAAASIDSGAALQKLHLLAKQNSQ